MPEIGAQQIISGFVTGAGSVPAAGSAFRGSLPTSADAAGEFYFHLQVVEEIPADPFADPQRIDLQPGQQIHIRVTTSDNGVDDQRPFKIRGNLQLALVSGGAAAQGIKVADARLRVARADLDTLTHDFEITLSDQSARGDATFELLFIEDGKNQKSSAARITRFVAGNENPIDQTLLESVKVNLTGVPPEQVAILHIEAPSAGKYRMRGWNRRVDLPTIEIPKPDESIGLADFVEGAVSPDAVRGIIKSVSRRASQQLLKWFQQLHRKHGQKLCLIIADHTDAEIPWEMLEFEQGKNLGATCVVARWIPVQNFAVWQELAVNVQESTGSVVAHLDYEELQNTGLEQNILKQLKADFRDSTKELRQRLQQPLRDVGLVYLACHGIFTYNAKHKAAVGSLRNPSERISAVQLEDLQEATGARPLFFVNACHSARLMRDGLGFYGLPEVLLALLASGYIGTLGPVGTAYAPTIGHEILEKARNSPAGINPAEELRRIRADAVRRLALDPSPENQLNFVFVFMYVYYGNPLACLRLINPAARGPDE